MASTQSELIVRIGAKADQFQDELEKVGKKTANLEKQLNKVAKISGVAFAAGTAAIAGATIAAGKFEEKFTNVVTLLDETSFKTKTLEQGIDGLKKGVLELGQETGESFETLNTALFDLVSSGVPAEEAIDTLRVTTELAAAGATDTATAVQALTATMTSFGDEAGTAAEISEKFFTAQKFGVTTVGELASEFSKVAGTANALGLSFDETLASLSALTADGAKPTNVAATQLKATLTSIINVQKDLGKESAAVQDALDLQNVKQRGLVATLDLLKQATGGNVSEMQRLLGSAESLSVALSLTGAQSELVAKQVKEMGDEERRAAIFAEALATKKENTTRAIAKFNRAIETAAIVIGEQFAPLVAKAAELLASFFQILSNNPVLAKTAALALGVGTAMAGLATALALGATAFLNIRKAMIAMNITTRVLAISVKGLVGATGIGLLLVVAAEILANWEYIWPKVAGIFSATVDTIANLGSSLGKILKGILTLDSKAISEGIDGAKKALVDGMDGIIEAIKKKPELSEGMKVDLKLEGDTEQIKDEVKKVESSVAKEGGVTVPVKLGESSGGGSAAKKSLEDFKKGEKEKTDFLTQEQKERIANNKAALEVMKAEQRKATQTEIDLIKRKAQLALEEEKALNEKNDEVRNSELEKIKLQKEILLQDEQKFQAQKAEIERQRREEKLIFDEEFNELSKEQQALFREEELETMQERILTDQEIEKMEAERKLAAQIERRNKYLQDEKNHGAAIAKLEMILASDRVKLAKQSASELIQLSQSKNDALKSIGKAAAVAQIAIDTAQGAASIFAKLNALVPIAAPAIGAVGAGAIIAFGAEKTANVLAANTGGMVPRNMGIAGQDSVNALLTPGELVVPEQNFDEVVNSVAATRSGSTTTETPNEGEDTGIDITITLDPTGDLMDMIEQKIVERRIQGVGIL